MQFILWSWKQNKPKNTEAKTIMYLPVLAISRDHLRCQAFMEEFTLGAL